VISSRKSGQTKWLIVFPVVVRLEERGPPPAAQAVVLHDQYNAIITDYYKLVHTETGNAIAIKHLELKQKVSTGLRLK